MAEQATSADHREDRAKSAKLRKPGMVQHGTQVMHWRERAALPQIAPDFYAYEAWGGQGEFFIERRLFNALRDLGAVHFRSWPITRFYAVPAYPLGLYAEGWRVAPEDMDPPHREADFWFPLVDGVPYQSTSVLVCETSELADERDSGQ